MVDYNIAVPQPYDPSGDVANALRFRAAQQAEAENQLKMQAWLQDREYTLKQRQAAAANAAATKARQNELLGIYGNFGVTPAVTGRQGVSYSGTGVANDPFETTRNQLLQRGFGAQAEDLTKVQNEILTGRKTATETKGLDLKNLNDRLSLLQRFAPMVNSPEDAAAYSRMLTKEFPEFAGLSGTPDEAAQRSATAFAQDPDSWRLHSLNLTAEQLVQANAKAAEARQPKWTEVDVGGEKQFVDTNPQSPTAGQTKLSITKTLTPAETAANEKTKWEQAHPDYTLQETAQGMVAVNKKDPTDVKPIQLGGQTVMPVDKRSATGTTLSKLIAERDALPEGDPRRAIYDTAIDKESGSAKAAAAANVKLEPGQRLNEKGDIEDVPGSKPYILHSKAHAKDYQDVATLNLSTDTSFKKIDDILSPAKKSDFDNNFGYGSSATSRLPGARDVARTLESIKSGLKEAGLKVFRSGGSIGQMTEKEWPIVEQLIGSLNSDQSPEQARQTLAEIKTRMERMRNIANDTYDTQWGATQYYKPELTKKETNIFDAADAIIGGK